MTDNINENEQPQEEAKQFDIVWLIAYLWGLRKLIVQITGVVLILAIIFYISKPKKFTVETSILPHLENGSNNLKNLSNLASMVGADLSSMTSSSGTAITPLLYSEIVMSTPSLIKLMEVPLTWEEEEGDTIMSLYDHTKADTIASVGDIIFKYTLGLPGTIMGAIAPKPEPVPVAIPTHEDELNGIQMPLGLDKVHEKCIGQLRSSIIVELDETVDLVRITVEAENGKQASELALAVLDLIQTNVTHFKTANAHRTLNFIQERYDTVLGEYETARREFYAYKDTHRDYVEERSDVYRQRLSDDYNLSYTLLSSLQQSLENAKIEMMRDTPVFSIVEPVVIPSKKSSPKLLLHLLGGGILGGILAVGFILIRLGFWQVFNVQKYKEVYEKYRQAP